MLTTFLDPRQPPAYANQVEFLGNPAEIRLRFYLSHPGHRSSISAEIILPPMVAKGVALMLQAKIEEWESEYGIITLPDDVRLLESLFGAQIGPKKNPGDEDDKQDTNTG